MPSTVQTAVEQVPASAWAALLALVTLTFGYRIAVRTRTQPAPAA